MMPCYLSKNDGCKTFICGELGEHCADCMDVAENLCDYPVGENKTCDRLICDKHSQQIAHNMHYCTEHFKQWEEFIKNCGLENFFNHKRTRK